MANSYQNIPTVTAADPFNSKEDAESLKNAMKGDGSNEKAIISILTRRTSAQRQQIKAAFMADYGKDLAKALRDELKGNFEVVLVALLTSKYDFLAQEIHHAISGLGTDESDLVEIICSASNEDQKNIKASYVNMFHKNMEKAIKGDTSGDFRKLLITMCQANRDESTHVDVESAKRDAKTLLKAGVLRIGTDEDKFTEILSKRSYNQLKQIFVEYKNESGNTLLEDIKKEFSGFTKEGLIAIIKSTLNKPEFFAERLHKTVKGIGTAERDLIRILVTRSEIDLGNIKKEYKKLYGKGIESVIADDVSGDFRKVVLGLLED